MEPPPYSQGDSVKDPKIENKPPTNNNFHFPSSLAEILKEPVLVVESKIEDNDKYKHDQAKKYRIYSGQGKLLGHMAGKSCLAKTIRKAPGSCHSFIVLVTDTKGELLLEIKRSFTAVNSTVKIRLPYRYENQQAFQTIGYSHQIFNPLKRKYKLATKDHQGVEIFGKINCKPFAASYAIYNECQQIIGLIDRNWTGIARKLESSTFVIRFDLKAPTNGTPYYMFRSELMGLCERAVLMGCAISMDLDYFISHLHHYLHNGIWR